MGSPGIDELRWLKPVRPGDTLSLRTTVLEVIESRSKPDRGLVRNFCELLNQHGEVVMSIKPITSWGGAGAGAGAAGQTR
jgi:acyl dehydratase